MVEKRFDVFTTENYKKVIGRMRELIVSNECDKIKEEFGNPTNDIWETSSNFLSRTGADTGELDIIHFTSDYSNIDAYLYLAGDVENGDATLCYVVRNENCDVFDIGEFSSVEELVEQLNKEYNALVFFDELFTKVEKLLEDNNDKLRELNMEYEEKINTNYFFNNFDTFTEAFINPNNRSRKVRYFKEMIDDLVKVTEL